MAWTDFIRGSRRTTAAWTLTVSLTFITHQAQAQDFYWQKDAQLSDSQFVSSFNWTANQNGNGARPKSNLDDDFAATTDATWSLMDSITDGTTAFNYTQHPGAMTLISKGRDVGKDDLEMAAMYRADIKGNFDVTVKVVSQTVNASQSTQSGILSAVDVKNFRLGGVCLIAVTPRNGIIFRVDSSGSDGNAVGYPEKEWRTGTDTVTFTTFPVWLRLVKNGGFFSGFYRKALDSAWVQVGKDSKPQGGATNSQVSLYNASHNSKTMDTVVFDDFEGGGTFQPNTYDLSFNGLGATRNYNSILSGNTSVKSLDFTTYSGNFILGANTLTLNSGDARFGNSMGLSFTTGTLDFSSSTAQTFTPKASLAFPPITHSGAGTTTVAGNPLTASSLTIGAGGWDWGSSPLTHTVASIATSGNASMAFGSNKVIISSGNGDFSGLASVTAGTGTLSFGAASGIQTLTVKAGAAYPGILHDAAGTIKLAGANLACAAFTQTAGTFDFNGFDLAVTGDMNVTGGSSTSFASLGGRTITVGGKTIFTGSSGNLLDLNPATGWTINSTGSLYADFAAIKNSDASATHGTPTANCTDGGGNHDWDFPLGPAPVPAKIIRQPSDTTVKTGQKAIFSMSASGDKPITFQWRKKGDSTVIATDSVLAINAPDSNLNGAIYIGYASNAAGKDTSREAKLTVLTPTCDSVFTVSNDTTVDEGQVVHLTGVAKCAVYFEWSAVSGPTPRILDPEVNSLSFAAPRVAGDSVLVLRFQADFGAGLVGKDVQVHVKEAIPDPVITVATDSMWTGDKPLIIKPALTNASVLGSAAYHPSLTYQWTLSELLADTSHAGDSLVLSNPNGEGTLGIDVCVGNGGTPSCGHMTIHVNPATVSIGAKAFGPHGMANLIGNRLVWRAAGRVRILDWQGRTLWERVGTQGKEALLPAPLIRSMQRNQCLVEMTR